MVCSQCALVQRAEATLADAGGIVTELPKMFDAFHANHDARTCADCGTMHPGKGKPPEGWVVL